MYTDKEVTNAFGMNATQIAAELRKKYFEIACFPVDPEWDKLPANQRASWVLAVEMLFIKCERMLQNISAKAETEKLVDTIKGPGTYKKLPTTLKIVWEAVLRHALNIITAGTQMEPGESKDTLRKEFDEAMADDWHDWVQKRIEMERK